MATQIQAAHSTLFRRQMKSETSPSGRLSTSALTIERSPPHQTGGHAASKRRAYIGASRSNPVGYRTHAQTKNSRCVIAIHSHRVYIPEERIALVDA